MLGGSIRKLKSSAVAALVATLAAASPSLAQSARDRVLVVAVATKPASVDSETGADRGRRDDDGEHRRRRPVRLEGGEEQPV